MAELSEVHDVYVHDDRDGGGALVFQAVPPERPADPGSCAVTREVILAWESSGIFRFDP